MIDGVSEKSMKMILDVLSSFTEIEGAFVFGSRSMGNYKNGSDIDIAIFGLSINQELISEVSAELNERLPLPYYFDIVHYEAITSKSLKEHIDRYGKGILSRKDISMKDYP